VRSAASEAVTFHLGAACPCPSWREPEIKLGLMNDDLGVREDRLAVAVEKAADMIGVEMGDVDIATSPFTSDERP
jgi:hypothetical protein